MDIWTFSVIVPTPKFQLILKAIFVWTVFFFLLEFPLVEVVGSSDLETV